MKRISNSIQANGIWSVYIFFVLLFNYFRVFFIRKLLKVPDIYFQGSPKIVNRNGIFFGRNFQCGKGAWIEAVDDVRNASVKLEMIVIGDNFTASEYLHLAAAKSVSIGHNVLIGSHVLITDHSHGSYGSSGDDPGTPPNSRKLAIRGPVIIGNNVWICDGAKILSGVTIGNGAVIAANSVVRENVPENCIYSSDAKGKVTRRYNEFEKKWFDNE